MNSHKKQFNCWMKWQTVQKGDFRTLKEYNLETERPLMMMTTPIDFGLYMLTSNFEKTGTCFRHAVYTAL